MGGELILPFRAPARAAPPAAPGAVRGVDAYGALLADARNPRTHRARVQDVADLARYLGLADPAAAATLVVAGPAGRGNTIALGYSRHLLDRGLAAATINRRLSTLRRLVLLARRLGLIDWALDVDGLKAVPYRDTTGPGAEGWQLLLKAAAGDTPKARRDRALLRLLHDNALRRGEVLALDVADVDLEGGRVAVVGKGRSERSWVTLNGPTREALQSWLEARGSRPGALFVRLDRAAAGRPSRLDGDGLWKVIRDLGRKAGLARPVRPHGLRHQGISRALDLTGGDVRKVQRFSRHAKAETVLLYDDARTDLAGEVSRLLGADA